MKSELSLYLHFPFCKQKCFYCNFNSYSGLEPLIPLYIGALMREMEECLPQRRRISSVYFGGGTPSYIPAKLLQKLMLYIKAAFLITGKTEITVEANPGSVKIEDLILLREAGFNRISIGLQAVQNRLLKTIGRMHTWDGFLGSYDLAREAGFTNVGVDLIFGLPGQTIDYWRESLEKVTALRPEHISAYGLQLEEGTPLAEMVAAGSINLPTEDESVEMMRLAMSFLPEQGYEHYEIANYARHGYQSIHNLGYWGGRDYLGFGAGATSTVYEERRTNEKDPRRYIEMMQAGEPPTAVSEMLDKRTRLVEEIMLGLRLRKGINLAYLAAKYGTETVAKLDPEIGRLYGEGMLAGAPGQLVLAERAIPVSNQVIGRLMATV
jgi:oxygen-independent coproporphyrinogen-3 oxidase